MLYSVAERYSPRTDNNSAVHHLVFVYIATGRGIYYYYRIYFLDSEVRWDGDRADGLPFIRCSPIAQRLAEKTSRRELMQKKLMVWPISSHEPGYGCKRRSVPKEGRGTHRCL